MIDLLNVSGLAGLVWKEQLMYRALAFITAAGLFTQLAGDPVTLKDPFWNKRMTEIKIESAYSAAWNTAEGVKYLGWSMEDYP